MSRVYGLVRLLAGILLLTSTASAEVELAQEDGVEPLAGISVGAFFTIHAATINGVSAGALGPTVEVALGFERTQYFVEGTYAWASFGPEPRTGSLARGAAGVRWIARSLDIAREAAIEMTLEASAGAHRYQLDGDTLVRPELGFGVALQIRKYRRPRFAMKYALRAFWAPIDDDAEVLARGGAIPATASETNGGLMVSIGVSR